VETVELGKVETPVDEVIQSILHDQHDQKLRDHLIPGRAQRHVHLERQSSVFSHIVQHERQKDYIFKTTMYKVVSQNSVPFLLFLRVSFLPRPGFLL
jgi:hypothetical protein